MHLKSILSIALAAIMLGGTFTAEAKAPRKSKRTRVHTSATTGTGVVKGAVKSYGSDLSLQLFTLKRGKSDISVQYPVDGGNPTLVSAIRSWIKESIDERFTGSLDTPEAMMKRALSQIERGETLNQTISVTYSNDKVITLTDESYLYLGGAHGTPVNISVTFLRSTGTRLTAEMLPPIARIRPFIVNGLLSYFEVATPAELNDCLMGVTTSDLPYGAVSISDKGLVISYGAYEIAPYAAGMPQAVIPLSKLRPLLSSEASEFF